MGKKKSSGKKKSTGAQRDQQASPTCFPPQVLDACGPQHNSASHQYQYIPLPQIVALHPGAVYVSRDFLSPSECRTWVQCAESNIGFENVSHPATQYIAHRKCGRIQLDDTAVADALYERMRIIVNEVAKNVGVSHFDGTYGPVGLNHNIRLYKYEKGMSFGRHFDGSNEVPRFENGNTEITVLIYLSSCTGGSTRFYAPKSSVIEKKKKRKGRNDDGVDDEKRAIAYTPKEGSVLLHVHGDKCLEHEADPVLEGIKYVLRTDVVYATGRSE